MNKVITLLIIFLSNFAFAQKAIYYDKDWKETTKEKSTYYRPLPFKKLGELVLIKDYYNNGQLQFQSYFYEGDDTKYVGDAYWYDENGFDTSQKQSVNLSSQKELVYYNNDGTIWKKITYNKIGEKEKIIVYYKGKEIAIGKIDGYNFSGIFTPKRPDSYYSNPFDNEISIPVTSEETVAIGEGSYKEYKAQPDRIYTETIFWENGKPAKQVTKAKYDQFWDTAGNEIKGKSVKDKVRIYYYTKNDFAVKTKSITNLINTDSGYFSTETTYNKKGDIVKVTKKINQQLLELKTFNNGKEHVLKYQKGKPFDGDFNDTIGWYNSVYKMQNGKIIGEVIVNHYKTGKLLAKGEYTNGKPNNGTFVFIGGNKKIEISTYKNQKKNGLQQKFKDKWDENPIEEFEMKDDLLHGFRKIYSNNKTYVSAYKNGEVFEGEIISDQHVYTYKEGEVIRIDEFDENFNYLKTIETYENKQIKSKKFFGCYAFPDKKQNCAFTGTFKNEQPFEGYFIQTLLLNEFPLMDYYENGELKYQYSKDILKSLNESDYYEFDTKTTFKNGKVIDGFEFIENDKNILIKIGYNNNKANYIELNLFGIHFFNRFIFNKTDNSIYITDVSENESLKITNTNNRILAEMFNNENKLIISNKPTTVSEGTANTITIYRIENNKLLKEIIDMNKPEYLNHNSFSSVNPILEKIYSSIAYNRKTNVDSIFNSLITYFKNKSEKNLNDLLNDEITINEIDPLIASISYNENGLPEFGFKITEKNNKYLVEYYDNGKVIKYESVDNIQNIKKTINDIINQL